MKACLLTAVLLVLLQTGYAQTDAPPYVLVLGTTQDGGYPHIGCRKSCCDAAWTNDSLQRHVVALALVSPSDRKWWLFEATPDISRQLALFAALTDAAYPYLPEGIFITHAHIGHYTGLMQLGREAMNARRVPVYVLPGMLSFLEKNGPWEQLVKLENIVLRPLTADSSVHLAEGVAITAFTVPHRDEYSETAGFRIATAAKKYLFIPDIDKWSKFRRNIVEEVQNADVALLDATFFSGEELPHRNMEEVPHPFVAETMTLFEHEPAHVREKIHFIHFNHTNPLLWDAGKRAAVRRRGFSLAEQGMRL